MVFSSFSFLFLFLPAVIFLYVLIQKYFKTPGGNVFLLLASLCFYFTGEGTLGFLLVFSILWNYVFAILIRDSKKSFALVIGVCGNLLLLIYYKYFIFLINTLGLSEVISESFYQDIILPAGISFFSFQGISYLVDVNRSKELLEKNIIKVGLYISFFPQLIAGPILKFNEIKGYLSSRIVTIDNITSGSFLFIRGLVKKIVLANNFALIADVVFEQNISNIAMPVAWLGILFYTLQIYYDFSGYSDMAIGLGRVMGFKIPENFTHPYVAKSIRSFWRSWHISLSTWFRDYLYIPLGGSKVGNYRLYLNLFIVFFLTGLWHGASNNFIIWGMIHGFFIVLERLLSRIKSIKIPSVFKHVYTLLVVVLAWVFFRIEGTVEAIEFVNKLFTFNLEGDYYPIIYITPYLIGLTVLGVMFTTPMRKTILVHYNKILFKNSSIRTLVTCVVYLLLFMYSVMELSVSTHQSFIYFKF
jgi:alginate O-acetyltransferase complex protein AlgI